MNSEALIKFLASLNPEQHDTLITLLKRCLPAEQSVATSASKKFHLKVRNHGEGPYLGLLVESGYYRFHI